MKITNKIKMAQMMFCVGLMGVLAMVILGLVYQYDMSLSNINDWHIPVIAGSSFLVLTLGSGVYRQWLLKKQAALLVVGHTKGHTKILPHHHAGKEDEKAVLQSIQGNIYSDGLTPRSMSESVSVQADLELSRLPSAVSQGDPNPAALIESMKHVGSDMNALSHDMAALGAVIASIGETMENGETQAFIQGEEPGFISKTQRIENGKTISEVTYTRSVKTSSPPQRSRSKTKILRK